MKMCSFRLLIFNSLILVYTSGYEYETKFIEMPVDHFNFVSNETFQLRYLINGTYWNQDGGPIFFYTGNEGDIEMFSNNTGFVWEIAPKYEALVVFAEHRYYGKSLPYGEKSYSDPKYLGYLSSQQALADFVDLIYFLKSNQTAENESPVIAFGGSYGGMLSAWIRIKYPHVVRGSIAASAPILQFPGLTPCDAFYRIVTSDFQVQSSECSDSIRNSWRAIQNVTSSDGGKAWLSSAWKLCTPVNTTDDVTKLKKWLSEVYTNLAMLDYPYPTDFLLPLPANPIKAVCKQLPDSTLQDKQLLLSLFKAVSIYFNSTGSVKCLDRNSSAKPELGDAGWSFQACTEMVMPMCTNGKEDMFEEAKWDFQRYSDDCYKQWKVRPQEFLAEKMYGGNQINASSNIVFSNGLLDPWSSGGVLRNLSDSLISVIIPEGAHHLDLRESNPADPHSVQEARKVHETFIQKWIGVSKSSFKKNTKTHTYKYSQRILI